MPQALKLHPDSLCRAVRQIEVDIERPRLDGLVLAGGGDIDPDQYGGLRHETCYMIDPVRDGFELGLTRRALDCEMPLLAICRGMQILNIVRGGSHSGAHGAAELPASLIWLWRDYDPAKTSQEYQQDPDEKSRPYFRVLKLNRTE